MACCNHNCDQGRHCPARRRATSLARALAGYVVTILCLMSAASSLAIWLAKWGSA